MNVVRCLVLLCATLPLPRVQALTIEYDYSFDTGFFSSNATARTTLEAAGDFFASRIGDSLLGIDSGGGNNFTATFLHPVTNATTQLANLDLAADTIRVIVGARNLGSNVLAQAGPGGSSVAGSAGFLFNSLTRGQGGYGEVSGLTATDFALWGGAMVFDADTNWNYSPNSGPAANQFDFLSVALHEFGHVFGVGTAWSWDNQVNVLNRFTGTAATAVHGTAVPLQTGAAHWADGITSNVAPGNESFIVNPGALQETAFDPTLQIGRRKLATDLDLAALADIGWELVPPAPDPEPSPLEPHSVPLPNLALLLAAALVAVVGGHLSARPAASRL